MIQQTIQAIPHQAKITSNCGFIGLGVAHAFGWWHTYAGTMMSTMGLVWLGIQAYYFFKDRKAAGK